MLNGKLIVMEGACDGVGKSTQYSLLTERLTDELQKEGVNVINHHFPSYGTPQGHGVELYLAGKFGHPSELSPYFVNNLYASDRVITWNTELKEHCDNGELILLDRYTTSSIIYQSALIADQVEKEKFIDYICDYEYQKLGLKRPDNVIFLYAPFEVITGFRNKRTANEGIVNDIHEVDLEFQRKVYDNAMFVAKYLNWNMIDCSKGDDLKSVEEIHDSIYEAVKEDVRNNIEIKRQLVKIRKNSNDNRLL